jgi:hypothetical protein
VIVPVPAVAMIVGIVVMVIMAMIVMTVIVVVVIVVVTRRPTELVADLRPVHRHTKS